MQRDSSNGTAGFALFSTKVVRKAQSEVEKKREEEEWRRGKRYSIRRKCFEDPHEIDLDENANLINSVVSGHLVKKKAAVLKKLQPHMDQEPHKRRRILDGVFSHKYKKELAKQIVRKPSVVVPERKRLNRQEVEQIRQTKKKMLAAILQKTVDTKSAKS